MKKTLNEEIHKLNKAFKDFIFEIIKSIGLIWLIQKLKFELKDWVKKRI